MKSLFQACVLLGLMVWSVACGPSTTYQPPSTEEDQSESMGATLYKSQSCGGCHGEDGSLDPQGVTQGNLSASKLGEDDVFTVLRDGRGRMPAYGGLTETERWALVAYVISLRP